MRCRLRLFLSSMIAPATVCTRAPSLKTCSVLAFGKDRSTHARATLEVLSSANWMVCKIIVLKSNYMHGRQKVQLFGFFRSFHCIWCYVVGEWLRSAGCAGSVHKSVQPPRLDSQQHSEVQLNKTQYKQSINYICVQYNYFIHDITYMIFKAGLVIR